MNIVGIHAPNFKPAGQEYLEGPPDPGLKRHLKEQTRIRKKEKSLNRKRITRLRKVTHQYVNGEWFDGEPRPKYRTRKCNLIWSWNNRPFTAGRLRNHDYEQHFAGRRHLYYTGSAGGMTLALVDVDARKANGLGSPQGARQFATELRQDLPFVDEPSTGGNGRHGYVILDYRGYSVAQANALLGQIEVWAKYQAYLKKADIEDVEIKGKIPVFEFLPHRVDGKLQLQGVRYPDGLAKLPRNPEMVDHLPVIRYAEAVLKYKAPEWFEKMLEEKKALPRVLHPQEPEPVPAPQPEPQPIPPAPKRMRRAGSVSGKLISDAELGLLPFYAVVARQLLLQAPCPRTSRYRISVADIAIFLMLFKFFSDNMNADGSLPWVRFQALWTKLFQAGEVDRPFNGERFKDIRNWLSSLGYIDWDDETYWFGPVKGQGQAARWQASTGLLLLLQPRKAAGRETAQEPVRVHIRERGASLSVTPVTTDPHYKRPRLRLRQAEWLELACEYERLYGQAA